MPVLPDVGSSSSRPGSSSPAGLRRLDHRERDAVLDRAGRVLALELRVERARRRGDSRGSSTSGVSPTGRGGTSATRELRTPFPNVDGRAELPEHLVDAPEEPVRGRRRPPARRSARRARVAARSRRATARRSAAVSDSPSSIIRSRHSEPSRSTRVDESPASSAAVSIAGRRRSCPARPRPVGELGRLPRLEPLGRERDVRDHRAAGPKHARALGESAPRVDVDEDVAAPDPVHRSVVERHRLDRALDDLDLVREPGVGDRCSGTLARAAARGSSAIARRSCSRTSLIAPVASRAPMSRTSWPGCGASSANSSKSQAVPRGARLCAEFSFSSA